MGYNITNIYDIYIYMIYIYIWYIYIYISYIYMIYIYIYDIYIYDIYIWYIYIYMILVSENGEITVNLWGSEWGPCWPWDFGGFPGFRWHKKQILRIFSMGIPGSDLLEVPIPYIRPIFQAYVRGYIAKIWPYMVLTYLHLLDPGDLPWIFHFLDVRENTKKRRSGVVSELLSESQMPCKMLTCNMGYIRYIPICEPWCWKMNPNI